MPETIAFLRLVWSRDRKLVAAFVVAAIAGTLISFAAAHTLPSEKLSFMPTASLRGVAVFSTMLLTIVPASLASLGLFNFQINEEQLESPQSCCSHWLLRMPIESWKIAIVPVVMKTIWIGALWYLQIIAIEAVTGVRGIPWFEPSLSFSAITIAFLAVSWRPFRGGWWRVAALIVTAAGSIALLFLATIRTQVELQAWHVPGTIGVVLAYACSVGLLLHSLRLARTHATGIIPSGTRFATGAAAMDRPAPKRIDHGGVYHALAWHDLQRAKLLTVIAFGLGVIPLMIFAGLIGLNGATIFIAFLGSAVMAWGVLAGSMQALNQKTGSVLPIYLVASPIASYRIAWTRMVTSLIIQLPFIMITSIGMAGWVLFKDNRAVWMRWAESVTAEMSPDGDVFWIGLRVSIAIVLATLVVLHGRIVSSLWITMNGRDWIAGVFGCVLGVMILAGLMVPMSWFFRFETIEEVRAAAMWWLSMVPLVMATILFTKFAFALIAGVLLRRQNLAPTAAVTRVVVIWAVLVATLGLLMHVLIPDPRATALLCLAATAVFVPLGSVLWMPISVSGDRHR